MTFNKTQTSPHWRLIKESVLSTTGRQQEGGRGQAFTLRDWGPETVRREEGAGPEHCQGGGGKRGRREEMGRALEGQGHKRDREGQPDREEQRLREDRLGKQTKGQTGGQSEKTNREREIRTEPKSESLQSSTCKTPKRSDTM